MCLKTTKRKHAHVINSPIYATIRKSDLASTLRVQFALSCLAPRPLSFEKSNSLPFKLSKRVKVLHRLLLIIPTAFGKTFGVLFFAKRFYFGTTGRLPIEWTNLFNLLSHCETKHVYKLVV